MNANPATHPASIFTVPGGVLLRAEGMNEPIFFPHSKIKTILDTEGDVWARNETTNCYYLPGEPYAEHPADAETTLSHVEADYGLADINVPLPGTAAKAERKWPTAPLYQRGDVTLNLLSGREALILEHGYRAEVGHYYVVIEKGHLYPKDCYPQHPGAAVFTETYLMPTGQEPFHEGEIALLSLVYLAS